MKVVSLDSKRREAKPERTGADPCMEALNSSRDAILKHSEKEGVEVGVIVFTILRTSDGDGGVVDEMGFARAGVYALDPPAANYAVDCLKTALTDEMRMVEE